MRKPSRRGRTQRILRCEWLEDRRLLSGQAGADEPPAAIAPPQMSPQSGELQPTLQSLGNLSIEGSTEDKPQSKLWTYDGKWWMVAANGTGTWVWRLDGQSWTSVLKLTTSRGYRADVKPLGNLAHVLLLNGDSSQLASVEYVPGGAGTYRMWTTRPTITSLSLSSDAESASLDVDSTGRMWVASDVVSTVEVRYSNAPYTSFSAPITLASGIDADDISTVAAFGGNKVGVMWSNQTTERFGFRVHDDAAATNTWGADELPASQSAQDAGHGLADDHLNVAVASDGTLYVAAKTSYDKSGFPAMVLLVRRPSGKWDNLYEVDDAGTRPIIELSESLGKMWVIYRNTGSIGPIVYRESSISPIAFGPRHTLIAGTSINDPTGTKQNFTGNMVVAASAGGTLYSVMATFQGPTPTNLPPVVDAGPNRSISLAGEAALDGTVSDDGLPNPPGAVTKSWSKESGPGSVSFANANAVDTAATFSAAGTYLLRLTANDGALAAFDNVTVVVAPENVAPSVNAGPDRTIGLDAAAALDGTVSDDGLPNPPAAVTQSWSKQSGPGGVSLANANAVDTTATFTAAGTYVLRLTANDGALAAFDEVTAIVTPLNVAPSVNAGPNLAIELDEAAALHGTATDDGLPNPPALVTTTWTKRSGPGSVTFADPRAPDTTVTFSVVGTYVVRLTANDGALTAFDNVTVVVAPANAAPSVNAGPNLTIEVDDAAALDGTVSDDGLPNPPAAVTQSWSKQSGPGAVSFANANAVDTTATFGAVGTYVLRLTANDGEDTVFDETTVVVTPVNVAPSVDAGPNRTIELDDAATLDGTASDDGLPNPPGAVSQSWSKQSGPGAVSFADAGAIDTTATFTAVGTYLLRLTANDGVATAFDETTVIVTPVNVAPSVDAGPGSTIEIAAAAALNGTVSDDGLPDPPAALTQSWSKRSGTGSVTFANASAAGTTATFSALGTYVLRLTANDGGATAFAEVTIVITPNNVAPSVSAGPDRSIELDQAVALDGTVSDDGLPNPPGAVSQSWSTQSGPGNVSFANASAVDTTATFSEVGTYVLRLMANDGRASAFDETTVVVAPVNVAPSVHAGLDQSVRISQAALLEGSVSDDGLPNPPATLVTTWSEQSGPGSVSFADANAPHTTATFSAGGTYVLRFSASDTGATTWDDVTVRVDAPPVVDAGPKLWIEIGELATLDGTVSDEGLPNPPGIVTVRWSSMNMAGDVVFANPANADTTAWFSDVGDYVLRLTASDGLATSFDEVAVRVNPVNAPPTVDAGPDQSIDVRQSALLRGLVHDDDLPYPPGVFTTSWSKLSGPGNVVIANAAAVNTSATFGEQGTYVLQLAAFDGKATTTDTLTVTVAATSISGTLAFQDGAQPSPAYSGTRDTHLRAESPAGNSAANSKIVVSGSPDFGGLIQWDVSAIPADAVVDSATISLRVLDPSVDTYNIYQVLRPWVEDQATWRVAQTGVNWQTQGADGPNDRGSTVLGTVTASAIGTIAVQLNAAGAAVVQSWVRNPATNYGVLIQNYAGTADALNVSSSEATSASHRPSLSVSYNVSTTHPALGGLPALAPLSAAESAIVPANRWSVSGKRNQRTAM